MLTDDILRDVLLWKRNYKDIYYIEINNRIYIYRTLTRGEYFSILNLQKSTEISQSDILLEMCLLYPKYDISIFDNISLFTFIK